MANERQWYESWAAILVGAGVALVGFGWCCKLAIPAFGAAVGIAVAVISGGLVGSGIVASWVVPVASAGLAIGGGAGGLYILVKVVKSASKKPFEWILPVLSVFSGFIVDLCKEVYAGDAILRIAFGAITVAVFLGGGLLWRTRRASNCIMGTFLYLLPPSLVLLQFSQRSQKTLPESIGEVPTNEWFAVAGLLMILMVVAFLSFSLKDEEEYRA